jgi:hypothetical protein
VSGALAQFGARLPTVARDNLRGGQARLVEAEIIDPAGLSAGQREMLFRRLYQVHQKIFAGVTLERFVGYLARPDAIRTRIQIYRNECGEVVGYCAVHIFERELGKRTIGIIRAEAGVLPGYRGTSATLWFGGSEALRYKGLHPLRMTVLFATPVHPSSYHMLSKYLWRSYPYPGRQTPAWVQQLLETLAEGSGSEPADPTDLFLRNVGWITRETAEDREHWRASAGPDIKYYLTRNPGYVRGVGLAMIAPLTLGNVFVSATQYLWHLATRKIRSFWR